MNRWPQHKAAFWETAPFFRPLLPFAAGIAVYYSTALSAPIQYVLVALAVSFLGYLAVTLSNKIFGALPFVLLHVFLFTAGFTLSHFEDDRNNHSWFGNSIDGHATYLARITGPPAEKESTWKLPVEVLATTGGKVSVVTGKASLYIYKDYKSPSFQSGDSIMVPGNWIPVRNAGNPFEFDYATYCGRNNIYYQQFCSVKDIKLYGKANLTAAPLTDRVHNWCMRQLERYITDYKTMGLLQAMLLGDEVNLDSELRQSFSDTGIIHIIAISGGNVSIFFIVISALLWWMKDKRHLWLKYAIALPLVWFYVIMAGSSPSAIRAAVMFSLLALGVMLQKNNNSLNQLFATAFVLLCAQPAWLYSLGFQLSFVAVLSLIIFYTPIRRWFASRYKVVRALWSVAAASIAAEILVAPLVVYYFHNFPLMFLIANVMAYLFMGVVLVLGISIIVLSFIPAIASAIGTATVAIFLSFDKMITWLQQFNSAALRLLTITAAELLLGYLIITGVSVFLLRKTRPAIYLASSSALLLVCSFFYHQWLWLHQQRLVVYNTSHFSRIELIHGKQYKILGDTTKNKKITYAAMPAHITWQALIADTSANTSHSYTINGKTVLVLSDTFSPIHTDYLLLTSRVNYKPAELKQRYTPSLVVLSNTMSRKQQSKFCEECAQAGVNVHAVSEKGAFIIE